MKLHTELARLGQPIPNGINRIGEQQQVTYGQLYTYLCLPQQLQDHQINVCRFIIQFQQHWNDVLPVSHEAWELAQIGASLHDLGNMAKVVTPQGPIADEWQKWAPIAQAYRKAYGHDAEKATLSIMREIHLAPAIISLVASMGWENIEQHGYQLTDPLQMILDLADLLVSPKGFGFIARMWDSDARYKIPRKNIARVRRLLAMRFLTKNLLTGFGLADIKRTPALDQETRNTFLSKELTVTI